MASIALAWAGSFVGETIYGFGAGLTASGYSMASAIGGMVGSVVGGSIDRALFGPAAQSMEGPRLSDLTVQSSADGAAMPIVFGTARLAGNVIWSTGLKESSQSHDSGGGGSGGGGGGSYTTYTYSTDAAIAICEGPIAGIRRIWADSKLVYDVSAAASSDTKTASATFAQTMRVYLGTENQGKDPLIQATLTDTQCPAFLGTAYVVFEALQLADFGNRLPNFTFEVVKTGTQTAASFMSLDSYIYGDSQLMQAEPQIASMYYTAPSGAVTSFFASVATYYPLNSQSNQYSTVLQKWTDLVSLAEIILEKPTFPDPSFVRVSKYWSASTHKIYTTPSLTPGNAYRLWELNNVYTSVIIQSDGAISNDTYTVDPGPLADVYCEPTRVYELTDVASTGDGTLVVGLAQYVLSYVGAYYLCAASFAGIVFGSTPTAVLTGTNSLSWLASNNSAILAYSPNKGFIISAGGHVSFTGITTTGTTFAGTGNTFLAKSGTVKIISSAGTLTTITLPVVSGVSWIGACLGCASGNMYLIGSWSGSSYSTTSTVSTDGGVSWVVITAPFILDPNSRWKLYRHPSSGIYYLQDCYDAVYTSEDGITWVARTVVRHNGSRPYPTLNQSAQSYYGNVYSWQGTTTYGLTRSMDVLRLNISPPTTTLEPGTTTLQSVCSAILEYSPATTGVPVLSSSLCDVSGLSGNVRGYVISRPMTPRAALEPLMSAFFFDQVEEDGLVKLVARNGVADRTLVVDDLGAAEKTNGNLVEVTRNNETELPSEVDVTYSDINNDFQPGTSGYRRLISRNENRVAISLPLALNSQEAAQIAEKILNTSWYSGRHSYSFSLPLSQVSLSPGDVVSLPVYGQQQTARITGIDMGAPGLMKVSAVPDTPSLYSASSVAANSAGIGQSLTVSGPTKLIMLDCVMLRDTDTAPGWYVAMSGNPNGWRGGVLYKSADSGATWTTAVTAPASMAASYGSATVLLPDADCRVWDKSSVLTVTMVVGTPSSAASEAYVLNGGNAALIGAAGRWELIQYRTATLNLDGSYTLTDLLRGRRGTEWAASMHASNDTLILLADSTIQDLSAPLGEIGATRMWKAVSSGQTLEATDSETDIYTGERFECLSPVELGGGRDASGTLTMTWKRRDRINASWNNNSDVPMSEVSESYEVDVFASNAYTVVKRTLTGLSTPTATYTSENQVADFGGNQAAVYVRIYQVGSNTGRGHYLQGSI